MTIDVGYAHLALDDGTRARLRRRARATTGSSATCSSGPARSTPRCWSWRPTTARAPRRSSTWRCSTRSAIALGIAVVTKIDAVEAGPGGRGRRGGRGGCSSGRRSPDRRSSPVSASTGAGLDDVRAALVGSAMPSSARSAAAPAGPPTLAIDRVFTVKGRGVVVTGTLRGGPLARGDALRLVPGRRGRPGPRDPGPRRGGRARPTPGGRRSTSPASRSTTLHRGQVLTADPAVVATRPAARPAPDRPLPDRDARAGSTSARPPSMRRSAGAAATPSTSPDGAAAGDRPAGRAGRASRRATASCCARSGGDEPIVGGARPRRRAATWDLAPAPDGRTRGALAGGHRGWRRGRCADGSPRSPRGARRRRHRWRLAPDVTDVRRGGGRRRRGAGAATTPRSRPLATAVAPGDPPRRDAAPGRRGQRPPTASSSAWSATVAWSVTATAVRLPGTADAPPDPDPASRPRWTASSARSPSRRRRRSRDAARAAGCPPAGIRELERAGRIVVLEPDLAYAMSTYRDLAATALAMARATAPLTPAAYRDATGTSRKYVMAILEDLDRRGILRRTPDGHVPGPKAPRAGRRPRRDDADRSASRPSSLGRRPVAPVRARQAAPSRSTAGRCSTTRSTRSGRSRPRSSWSSRPTRIADGADRASGSSTTRGRSKARSPASPPGSRRDRRPTS